MIIIEKSTGLNADLMTNQEIRTRLEEGYEDIEIGNVQNAVEAFAKFRETH